MRSHFVAAGAGLFVLAACGQSETPVPAPVDPAVTTPPASATGGAPVATSAANATGPGTALGLTIAQLNDADLKDAAGADLGDVEGVVQDASGAITHLLVEVDDTSPDRVVQVPIAGLRAVPDGNDWDVAGDLTRDQLLAMPAGTR